MSFLTLFCFGLICFLNSINMISTEIVCFIQHIWVFCLLESQYPLSFFIPVSGRKTNLDIFSSYSIWGASFFEAVPLVEFMYLVFTRMPGGVTVDDVGLLLCPLSVECYYLPLFVDHCFLQTAATL